MTVRHTLTMALSMNSGAATTPKLKLQYFNIQGAAEKVRLAFVLGNIPFEDERVQFSEWGTVKPTTPYGQLPLLTIDGAEPMAQSEAMLRYAGTLANANGVPLYPSEDMLKIEEARGLVSDLERSWRSPVAVGIDSTEFGYPEGFNGTPEHAAVVKSVREAFVAGQLPRFMGYFEKRLSPSEGGTDFLCGAAPTIADCALVPVLNRLTSGGVDYVPTTCLEGFPGVCAYVDRFMKLEPVAKWYAE